MYRTFRAEKDAYITDRVIKGKRSFSANTGRAGSIDIYKLYGATRSGSTPNVELTRGLIKFDLSDLRDDLIAKAFDPSSPKFKCILQLSDVYGGQTTPANFQLTLHPLSMSFDEGIGRDVVFYQDSDICNFMTASASSVWFSSGANARGDLGSTGIDIMTSGNLGAGVVSLWVTQSFVTGDEDLSVDVTRLISGTLVGLIPDHGYRLSFIEEQESDQKTRFVKRFSSRHAADPMKHPRLIVKYDDSVRSDANDMVFDYPGTLFFYNKVRGSLRNIISSSADVTGSDCLKLKLITEVSGGTYTLTYSGSQHTYAGTNVSGTYYSTFTVPSDDAIISKKIAQSGSVIFDYVWGSVDGTVGYFTASNGLTISAPDRDGEGPQPTRYYVVATNVQSDYKITDRTRVRVHIEDADVPYIVIVRTPFITPSVIADRIYYSIRDSVSDEIVIPFDPDLDSTRMSSDSKSMWFDLDMSNLYPGHLYEIDAMIIENGLKRYYRGISAAFRVESTS